MPETDARGRSWFAPIVLGGLASAGLSAVAAAKSWYAAHLDLVQHPGVRAADARADMPLALALALVLLASWGVVLVSRTTGRRIVLVLGALAAAGVLACAVAAANTLPGQIRDQLGPDGVGVGSGPTGWYVVAWISTVLALACVGVGWRFAPRWPSMSSRYDAPAGASAPTTYDVEEPMTLWKAMDAGVDPTDPLTPEGPDAP
jgi:hypothetical protein